MAPAGERRIQPHVQDSLGERRVERAAAERQHVRVVVLAREARRVLAADDGRAHARVPVRRDRDADPGAADHDAAGAATADDNIRDTIDYEAQGVVRRNEGFVDRVLSFGGSGSAATPLDPRTEEQRLADEESIRRATGGGQVTIRRDRGGFKLPGT